MLEASEARELIEETVERTEQHDAAVATRERTFRERLSLLVGIFAVMLAVVHVIGAGKVRENIVDTIRASDTYNYMQAKRLRQEILRTAARTAPLSQQVALVADADALEKPDAKGHGIGQLQASADHLSETGIRAGEQGERFEWAETALQMAIVLISIAMIASSRGIAVGAVGLGLGGVIIAAMTYLA